MKTYYLLIFLFLFIFTGCLNDKEEKGGDVQVGDELPSFSIQLNDGTSISDKDLNDKVSMIILFSVLCGDCQKEFPVINELYEYFKDNDDVIIFGISRGEDEEFIQKNWPEGGLNFPYSAQKDKEEYLKFASHTVPRIYISDKDKVVKHTYNDDPLAKLSELINDIESLLE